MERHVRFLYPLIMSFRWSRSYYLTRPPMNKTVKLPHKPAPTDEAI